MRVLIVEGKASLARVEDVERYLPDNYKVIGGTDGRVIIAGEDVAGWTADLYVIPRLRSGVMAAREIDSNALAQEIQLIKHSHAEALEAELTRILRSNHLLDSNLRLASVAARHDLTLEVAKQEKEKTNA
jgi:hypothetical protein